MQQVNVKLAVMLGAVLATSLLVGCNNAEDVRRKTCAQAVLDMNQATRGWGDDRIDRVAVRKIIDANGCTYKDVLPEEERARAEELRKNPIPERQLKQNGMDWSKPWHDKKKEW